MNLILALLLAIAPTSHAHDVDGQSYFPQSNPNNRNEAFNLDLQRKEPGAKITSCWKLIDVPVGTAHGNHSFGGYCALERSGKTSTVEICNDDMVGHFKMIPVKAKKFNTNFLLIISANFPVE